MFLLVPADPGSPGQKAVKWLFARVCVRQPETNFDDNISVSVLRWTSDWRSKH